MGNHTCECSGFCFLSCNMFKVFSAKSLKQFFNIDFIDYTETGTIALPGALITK